MKKNLDNLWQDDKHWKWNSIYNCEDDPRVVIPKRRKWTGWTFNFAHRASIILIILVLAFAFAPTYYLILNNLLHLLPYAIGTSIVFTIIIILLFARIGRTDSS